MGEKHYNGPQINTLGGCGLDSSGSQHGQLAACEYGNEHNIITNKCTIIF